jgi:predicted PurR-regulated permease PerM
LSTAVAAAAPEAAPDGTPDATAPAAETELQAVRSSRWWRISFALGVLAVIAMIAALFLARAFFVPLLIGILASYTLRPVVDWLQARRIPRAVGAALSLLALVGSLSWVGYSLGDDMAAMIERLPEAARKVRQVVAASRTGGHTPLQNMQEAANEIQGAATDAAQTPGARAAPARVSEPTAWLRDYVIAQTGLLINVAAQAPMVLLLAYFLLASGVHFRRKLVQFVGPSLSRKKDAVRILEEIDTQVQRYMLATLLSNSLVGVATWLAFEAIGMENAGVWGVAAGVLHFIPYLGSALIVVASGVAALLQFGSVFHALAVAGLALLVAAAIGLVLMTWLQSRAARINPAVLFIGLLFLGWLWGIWGLLLGAPLIAIVKVVCDRVEGLKPMGELLGR